THSDLSHVPVFGVWVNIDAQLAPLLAATHIVGAVGPRSRPLGPCASVNCRLTQGETRGVVRGRVGAFPTDAWLYAASQGIRAAGLARAQGLGQERGGERGASSES